MTSLSGTFARASRRVLGACFGVALAVLAAGGSAAAQSEDRDSPTALALNVVEGEGDGRAATHYYSFTAGPGDVKVTVDGKTDNYSSPLRVKLSDEDGRELLDVYVVANKPPKRETGQRRFVRRQKVVLSVSMNDDPQVKLLSYRVRLDGAVTFEGAPAPDASAAPPVAYQVGATQTPAQATEPSAAATPAAEASIATEPAAATEQSAAASGKNKQLVKGLLNAIGERLNVPAAGNLRVEMKDGTVQEFDLTKVKKILVRQ